MKKIIWYFIVLLFAVWLGLKVAADPGYLLIAYQKVSVEMPLWFAALMVLGSFILLYILIRFVSNIRSLPARLRSWSRSRRVKRAWVRTHHGLIKLGAGKYAAAEKDLVRGAEKSDTPIINYLAAAHAAQAQHDYLHRDEHLRQVVVNNGLSELALGLTQAQLQLDAAQLEQALATLQRLQHLAPKHPPVLYLLQKVYLQLNDWQHLETLLPELKKRDVLTSEEWTALSVRVYQGLLQGSAAEMVWDRMPKELRSSPAIVRVYLTKFDARALDGMLRLAESELKEHANDAEWLCMLGELCAQQKLWGKARSYFETSLSIKPSSVAYYALGSLQEALGETQQALENYRKGLVLKI